MGVERPVEQGLAGAHGERQVGGIDEAGRLAWEMPADGFEEAAAPLGRAVVARPQHAGEHQAPAAPRDEVVDDGVDRGSVRKADQQVDRPGRPFPALDDRHAGAPHGRQTLYAPRGGLGESDVLSAAFVQA